MAREGSTRRRDTLLAVAAAALTLIVAATLTPMPAWALPGLSLAQASEETPAVATSTPAADTRPNIVVILADDVGLMDLGAYGGEARTPHIDALAQRGAVFTHYRASPLCSPSRAMLLTGMDSHLTGVSTIPEVLPAEQKGQPGYTMALEPGVLTLADHLRAAGYRTLMSGKWHLGEAAEEMPHKHGFDRSFALAASGADNWEDRSYMPYYKDAPWWEDGEEASLPDDFYSSRFIVDTMLRYLEETDAATPFFAYLPFQAVHIPVQAPQRFIDKYKGRYDAGWDALRAERHVRAQELGFVPDGAALAALPPQHRAWESLGEADRALYAARMEAHAAMLEAMDFHIGRLIAHLKQTGRYDNTIFVVTSDNGPEPTRGDNSAFLSAYQAVTGYDVDLETVGQRGHWGFIGPEWAVATATPGAWYKFYSTEGGVRVPLIVAGPGLEPTRIASPAMTPDLAPTLLEWAGAQPITQGAKPMTGRSLMPVLTGETLSAYEPGEVRAIEVSGNSALYKGDYKITRSVPPRGDNAWRLFNLANDPGETTDLSAAQPEVLADMLSEYDAYAARVGALAMPEGYDSVRQIIANTRARLLQNYPWIYAVLAGLALLGAWAVWRLVRLFVGLFAGRARAA
ncbi:MAG: arylsulfatase [Erythrobacter sp.]|uniref:arylsulfatase n=1 Tax=Erythrobacter sp. TaxID=1042 RepID=UPI00261A4E19|nr:arylsulfatase [Erythrobacter sp.]MDJ0979221.1 arylsulfatase [Erythrobacter sp.]